RNSGQPIPPPPSAATGTLTCSLSQSSLQVDIAGPIQDLLVGGSVSGPTAVLYGANTDTWAVPYSSGKPLASWNGTESHTLQLSPDVNGFNLFLSNGSGGNWFDLVDADWDGDKWTVAGDCWLDGTEIVHGPADTSGGGIINCIEAGSSIQVEIIGPVQN